MPTIQSDPQRPCQQTSDPGVKSVTTSVQPITLLLKSLALFKPTNYLKL